MRHFAKSLLDNNWPVFYTRLDDANNTGTLAGELEKAIRAHKPQQLVITAPGEWRVLQSLRAVAKQQGLSLEIRDDTHFFSTVREFAEHAKGRKQLRQRILLPRTAPKDRCLDGWQKACGWPMEL
jgi:deoxyribodipyrimidine photolyase-related protein